MRDERANAAQAPAGNEAAVPYKAVLIIGKDINLTKDILDQYRQEGYLLIGDGKHELNSEYMKTELKKLEGNIDFNTRIYINAHGLARNNIHTVDGMRTRDFLEKLERYSGGNPLSVQLISCYGGAAAPDVSVLPEGSVLLAHSPSYTTILVEHANPLMLESSRGLSSNPDLIQDFANRFVLNVLQTATISVKKSENEVFKYTVRFNQDKVDLPKYTHEIIRFLDFKRAELAEAYKQNLYPNSNFTFPEITRADAERFTANLQFHIESLNVNRREYVLPEVGPFADYINHSGPGKTPLMEAVMWGDYMAVTAILASSSAEDINAKDAQGYTALMAAAINGNTEIIEAMLASPKIDKASFMMQNQLGYTPLMMAASGAYGTAVLDMLKSEKAFASASMANSDGKTALDLAVAQGGNHRRDVGNGKKVGSVNEIALQIIDAVYRLPLAEAVKNNNEDKFNQLLPGIIKHPFAMKEAFIEAAINNRLDMLEQMLPHISKYQYEKDEKIIETAFIEALKHQDDTSVLSKLLPHLEPDSAVMQKAFADAVINNDGDRFAKMLERMVQKPKTMHFAFAQAILNKREDMFDKMLPHIDPESDVMKAGFIEAVKKNDDIRFNKMLPRMLQKPHTMDHAFIEAVLNNRGGMFDKMLERATSDAMREAFTNAVTHNRANMFDKMLPYVKQTPHQMQMAFNEAVSKNDADKFNKMLPHMISNPSAMDVAIVLAVIHNRTDMFDKMLPHIPQDSIEMTRALKWSILTNKADMFGKILPRATPRLMAAVFDDINTVEVSTLPVKDSKERLKDLRTEYLNALSTSIGNIDPSSIQWERHWGYLKQLLMASNDISGFNKGFVIRFVRSDAELIVNVINKIGKSDPWYIESLEIELANMIQNPEMKQQLIAEATKSENQELLGKINQLDRDNQELLPGIERGLTADETRAALELAKQDSKKFMRIVEKAYVYNWGLLNKLMHLLTSEMIHKPEVRQQLLAYPPKPEYAEVLDNIRQYEESFKIGAKMFAEFVVNNYAKQIQDTPGKTDVLNAEISNLIEDAGFKQLLFEAATKLGSQQILDIIRKTEVVKMPVPEALPSNVGPMVLPTVPQATVNLVPAIAPTPAEPKPPQDQPLTNITVTPPDFVGTAMLAQAVLGIKNPQPLQAEFNMQPFSDIPPEPKKPAVNWVEAITADSLSKSASHDWSSQVAPPPNESGGDMPHLDDEGVKIHTAEPLKRPKPEKRDVLAPKTVDSGPKR